LRRSWTDSGSSRLRMVIPACFVQPPSVCRDPWRVAPQL
jgi:hypothetical protein